MEAIARLNPSFFNIIWTNISINIGTQGLTTKHANYYLKINKSLKLTRHCVNLCAAQTIHRVHRNRKLGEGIVPYSKDVKSYY